MKIPAEVSQSNILKSVLFLLYTNDISNLREVRTVIFADDTAILTTDDCMEESTKQIRNSCQCREQLDK